MSNSLFYDAMASSLIENINKIVELDNRNSLREANTPTDAFIAKIMKNPSILMKINGQTFPSGGDKLISFLQQPAVIKRLESQGYKINLVQDGMKGVTVNVAPITQNEGYSRQEALLLSNISSSLRTIGTLYTQINSNAHNDSKTISQMARVLNSSYQSWERVVCKVFAMVEKQLYSNIQADTKLALQKGNASEQITEQYQKLMAQLFAPVKQMGETLKGLLMTSNEMDSRAKVNEDAIVPYISHLTKFAYSEQLSSENVYEDHKAMRTYNSNSVHLHDFGVGSSSDSLQNLVAIWNYYAKTCETQGLLR